MEATTIKIHEETKLLLDEIKDDGESYDFVINRMVSEVKNKNLTKELVEAYGRKAKEDKQINKEWDKASLDWE